MKSGRGISVVGLVLMASLAHAQRANEWKLDLSKYGLVKTSCVWYPGRVEFLDDEHLVIGAPVNYACDKSARDQPADTRITVIDLQGHESASMERTDVVRVFAGPAGHVAVCTGTDWKFFSRDLKVTSSIAFPASLGFACHGDGDLNPSRSAVALPGPGDSQVGLYQGSSGKPIAEVHTSRGQSVQAAEDGFLVCEKQEAQCLLLGTAGGVRRFAVPKFGFDVVGLLAQDKLLIADDEGRRLYAETPTGDEIDVADIAKLRPPFVNTSGVEMSAVEPRRILYHVDGCLLGDFDDCYGVVFRRFAVFDSQTSRLLFRHGYAPGADLDISPNGRIVMERDGAEVHLFQIP